MLVSPKEAIENGWISHPDCYGYQDWEERKFISPNAIDFTLDRLSLVSANDTFTISEKCKIMRGQTDISTQIQNDVDSWKLFSNTVYDGMSDMFVRIPENVCAELIIRSTFSRNGIFLTSGLYDSKYEGHIGFALHNRLGDAVISRGIRIGQIKFIRSDSVGGYAGGYNHAEGTHWTK